MKKILIITDNFDIQSQMKWGLAKNYVVLQALDGSSALRLFNENLPPVVILDIRLLSDGNNVSEGLSCLRNILKEAPETYIIILSDNNNRENALKAIQMGAYNYYLIPVDMSELKVIIRSAFQLYDVESENMQLKKEFGLAGMIGQSPEMQKIYQLISKVAITDIPILIIGETGTGKELIARTIHEKSSRTGEVFIPINCSDLSENLIESAILTNVQNALDKKYIHKYGKLRGTIFFNEISRHEQTRGQT